MSTIWDQRYSGQEFLYGTEPNSFFKDQLAVLKPGSILLPAEGEGRNAVYAASQGWTTWAFDSSKTGQAKALRLASQRGVSIQYDLGSVESFFPAFSQFDVIGLFFTHFPREIRTSFFKKLQMWIKPGGLIILEAFSKNQIHRNSGGPKDLNLLYSLDEIRQDFSELSYEILQNELVHLNEGPGHQGEAEVVRLVGKKQC